jgi:ATP-dependent Lon protease
MNEKDLRDVPDEMRANMAFTFASTMDEVFRLALLQPAQARPADQSSAAEREPSGRTVAVERPAAQAAPA